MTTNSTTGSTVGTVSLKWVGKDGSEISVEPRHNTTTFASASAVAMAYAGDSSYIPRNIAFIYGSSESDILDGLDSGRSTTWTQVEESCESHGLGIAITQFSYKPTMSSSDENHAYNKVTFHGRTQNIDDNKRLYKACLIGKGTDGSKYNLLAIVDLGNDGQYKEKPVDFELAIDWAVTFN